MALEEAENQPVQRRKSSVYQPLLPNGEGESLYKTLSHSSDFQNIPVDPDTERAEVDDAPKAAGVYTTLSVLLLGVFVSQIDQSFVIATYGAVSSEFNDLESGSWLVSAYILAQCVAQPLYGKLSDVYGRKACLQVAYVLFAIGTTGSGLGRSMSQVIASRAVQGAGGAGMTSMVAIIVTDLVPLREVASMWSYINILQTTGRSCGGLLGGLLTQTLGWRWAFLVQTPPIVIAILLVQWRLKLPTRNDDSNQSRSEKLRRIDFVGALFLCYTIFAACFLMDVGGQRYAWDSPTVIVIITSGLVSAVLFVIRAKRAKEPIFPLRLIAHRDVATNYIIVMLQVMVQVSLMLAVPLYFQATTHASTAAAGAYLIPAFVGNTLGGLLSGYWIRKTGLYKVPTVVAPILSITCMLLILFLWNGNTGIFKSLFTFFGGFANGTIANSAFVGVAAAVPEADVAMAGSGLYLFFNLGAIAGASAGAALYQTGLRTYLAIALQGVERRHEILTRLVEDIEYLWTLSEKLRRTVMPAYVQSFHRVMLFGLACAGLSLVLGIFSRGKRLLKK